MQGCGSPHRPILRVSALGARGDPYHRQPRTADLRGPCIVNQSPTGPCQPFEVLPVGLQEFGGRGFYCSASE